MTPPPLSDFCGGPCTSYRPGPVLAHQAYEHSTPGRTTLGGHQSQPQREKGRERRAEGHWRKQGSKRRGRGREIKGGKGKIEVGGGGEDRD
jgi:hypothetical protein